MTTTGTTLEHERLEVLRRHQILDTVPEETFDRITRLAAKLFDVPIVLVSLVDETRQWFKSCYGLDTRETVKKISFCMHAIEQDGVMVVPDATEDARFRSNPLVTGEPFIRFYAGAPLRTSDGFKVGTLCIIDQLPHSQFTPDEEASLQDLAAMVVSELESRGQYRKLFMDAPIGIYRTTPSGQILMANPSLIQMLEYESFEELVARKLEEEGNYHPEHPRSQFKEALHRQGEIKGLEAAWTTKHGRNIFVRENARVAQDEQGNILYYEGTVEDITEKKKAEETLRQWEQHYHLALQSANAGTWEYDFRTDVEVWSDEAYTIYGLDEGVALNSKLWESTLHPEDWEREHRLKEELVRTQGEMFDRAFRIIHPTKGVRWIETRGRVVYSSDGEPLRMFGVDTDITSRKQTEQALQESQHHLQRMAEFRHSVMELVEESLSDGPHDSLYHRLLEKAVEVIPGAQAGSILVHASDGFDDYRAAVGYDLATLQQVRFPRNGAFHHMRHLQPELLTDFSSHLNLPEAQLEVLRTAGGLSTIKAALAIPVVLDGKAVAYMMLDNFDSKDAFADEAIEMARIFAGHIASLIVRFGFEEELHHLAYQDSLTKLPNRAQFKERLEEDLVNAERDGSQVAVLFVDLDNLKPINDSLGHKAGDEVLRSVAERLKRCTRATDMVARLSGDEFTVILPSPHAEKDAKRVAERILGLLAEPISAAGHEVHTSASIGISLYPSDGATYEDLFKHGDIAMYHAKQRGKNTYSFFAPEMEAAPLERLLLEEGLRKALEHDQFLLHYQPRVDFKTGRIVGFEALVRWQHPERGLIPPGLFIPLAENTSLIHPLGRRVMEMACRQAKAWQEQGFEAFRMAVNLSAKQLQRSDIIDEIQEVLIATGLPASMLEVEMLESAAMTDIKESEVKLKALKALGVRIALDDFGTGYSSLAYLRDLPIDTMKIDRSFLEGLRNPASLESNLAIIRAITALGQNLGLAIVAEGIEERSQWHLLKEVGCDEAQGYLLSRPVPPAEIEPLLRHGTLKP
jgi:diguanylate cyclase (GGDEF)-like protein/PAS domain S-box-containing protein